MMDAIGRTILAALILSTVMRNMNDMIPNSNLSNLLPGGCSRTSRQVETDRPSLFPRSPVFDFLARKSHARRRRTVAKFAEKTMSSR
jgi:hypothetical protein